MLKKTQLQRLILKKLFLKKIVFTYKSNDNQKKNNEQKFILKIPYKPKNEKKNQLIIIVIKKRIPKKKKTGTVSLEKFK